MRAGYKSMFMNMVAALGGLEALVKLTAGPRNRKGPGRRSAFNKNNLRPMTPEQRAWMNRGLQVGSRECRRRRPAFYAQQERADAG